MTDVDALTGCADDQGLVGSAIQSIRDAAFEQAALECDRHAEFCKKEAHAGGDFKHLMTRRDAALYNAQRIRAMKSTQP